MKSLLIVCAAVACTIAASGCSGDGPPARSPFDPFGTEPAPTTGSEPTGGEATIAELCVQVCARLTSTCGRTNDTGCASQCAADSSPNCEAEFRAFLECLATATLNCNGEFIAPACEGALIASESCQSSSPTGQ
jgi:hypothetical protein